MESNRHGNLVVLSNRPEEVKLEESDEECSHRVFSCLYHSQFVIILSLKSNSKAYHSGDV